MLEEEYNKNSSNTEKSVKVKLATASYTKRTREVTLEPTIWVSLMENNRGILDVAGPKPTFITVSRKIFRPVDHCKKLKLTQRPKLVLLERT